MNVPVEVDIPHKLGREAAKTRIAAGIGKIADIIPGGNVTAHQWNGDTLDFTVQGLGQTVASRIEVYENNVHAVVDLPPFMALFAEKIRAKLQKSGPKLLE